MKVEISTHTTLKPAYNTHHVNKTRIQKANKTECDSVCFKGINPTLLNPQAPNASITTSTGVKYYLGTATGTNENQNALINPSLFPQSQRMNYNEVLQLKPYILQTQAKVNQIYNSQELPGYQWLCKQSIEREKVRANHLKQYVDQYYKGKIKDVIIVAMGGNVGSMKIAAGSIAKSHQGNTIEAQNGVKLHFIDSMEPTRINNIKNLIVQDPQSTLVCLVSQSGSTFETIGINTLIQDTVKLPPQNVIPIIGNKDSAIGSMAQSLNYQPLPNPMGNSLFDLPAWDRTGGRWSGMTAESSLAIALGGGDPAKWVDGYQKTIEDFIYKPFENNGTMQSALLDVAYTAGNKNYQHFFTYAYSDLLGTAGHALSQNVHESTPSLKDYQGNPSGKGLMHRFFVAPAAQHADMGLLTDWAKTPIKLRILEVANDKSADNPINFNKLFDNQPMPQKLKDRASGMSGLKGSQLMKSMAGATGYDAWNRGRPVEFVTIPEINETTMGSLLAEQYIKTQAWGDANKINVVRNVSFPDYKAVFKKATNAIATNVLDSGAANIFYTFVNSASNKAQQTTNNFKNYVTSPNTADNTKLSAFQQFLNTYNSR